MLFFRLIYWMLRYRHLLHDGLAWWYLKSLQRCRGIKDPYDDPDYVNEDDSLFPDVSDYEPLWKE